MKSIKHPAKYTDKLLPVFASMLKGSKTILDPFGGTGKIFELHNLLPGIDIFSVELEPEWANDIRGDALHLPFNANTFDAICTSCTYGNRMADRLGPPKYALTRNTYASYLGRDLSKNNSGAMQWGNEYREFHIQAWSEAKRVLKNESLFILNVKDHIRLGKWQPVTNWHLETLRHLGFVLLRHELISCPGNRKGENYKVRVEYESIMLFKLDKTEDL